MSITGQISLARSGENTRIFQNTSDINSMFDSNEAPVLQPYDHITLYPGDFTDINTITIPEDIYVTILPGAKVKYSFSLDEIDKANRLKDRYEHIEGEVKNVADLNISHLFETKVEKQYGRVRLYSSENQEFVNPYVEYNNLEDAAENAGSGNTIVVFPGEYTPSKNLLVDGATWKFLPGSKVTYDPNFIRDIDEDGVNEKVYPHALFDDSRNIDGEVNNSPKNVEILGRGTFIIGSQNQKDPLEGDVFVPGNSSEIYNENTYSIQVSWEGWHKYGILAVSNPSSNIRFEAKEVKMEETIDSPFKYDSSTKTVIEVEKVTVDNLSATPMNPSVLAINSHAVQNNNEEKLKISISEYESSDSIKLVYGTNVDPSNRGRIKFNGEVYIEVENMLDTAENIAYFREETSPSKIKLNNSQSSAPVEIGGNNVNLIVEKCKISTSSSPIVIHGDSSNIKVSLSESWILNNGGQFSIEDKSNGSNYEVRSYIQSFANVPIENYKEVLHDELNNVIWTEDVELI